MLPVLYEVVMGSVNQVGRKGHCSYWVGIAVEMGTAYPFGNSSTFGSVMCESESRFGFESGFRAFWAGFGFRFGFRA